MFCPKCGNSIPENAKFCSKCGHKIRGVSEINKDDKGRYLLENNKMQKKSGVHHKVRKYALLVASVLCVLIVIIAAYSMNQSRLIYEYNEAFYTATVIEVKKEYKEKITEIVIPQEVKYEGKTYTVARIQHDAFKGCVNLESVEIPNTVVYIGSGAFHECSSLKSIELSNQIKDINSDTFSGCVKLESIEIPQKVVNIYSNAFYGCSSLTQIELPKEMNYIGNNAFEGCKNLASVSFPEYVKNMGNDVFLGCELLKNNGMYYEEENEVESGVVEEDNSLNLPYSREDFVSDAAWNEYVNFSDLSGLKNN